MDDLLGLFDAMPDMASHEQLYELGTNLGSMETYQTIPRLDGGEMVFHDGHLVADLTPQFNGGTLIHTYDTDFHHGYFAHGSVGALDGQNHESTLETEDDLGMPVFDDLTSLSAHHDELGALTVGDPQADALYWHMQEDSNSCAVASQAGVLESLLHREVSESELAGIAYQRGWYDPASGTPPDAVGNLLEYYGVPVEREYDTPMTDVFDALHRGDKVIVALNANEIWEPQTDPDGQPVKLPVTGHAVWVTGMHEDDNGNWTVILNDTGTSDGRQKTVFLPDFMNAWEDFGKFSAITQVAEENPHVA